MGNSTNILIWRPGDPLHELPSYRPISLLSIVPNIIETLLLKRLLKMVKVNGFI
jgi:hypothetical protein